MRKASRLAQDEDRTCLNPDRLFLLRHIGFDKKITRAHGPQLYGDDGREYLDFLAQYGALPFGHNPDFLWQALDTLRANQEPSLVQPLLSPAAETLAQELIAVAPSGLRYVTFTNSGAESVEAGIKLARGATRRQTILGTTTGFHGKTLGAVSATGKALYRTPFLTDTTHFEHVPFNDLPALRTRLARRDVAAFIVEPVQGEGGMLVPEPGYLAQAQALCREAGTLFVLDEVQTGLGRTGRLFAAEHEDLQPDILLLAKALGGGFVSLGACLCTARVWSSEFGYYHSSTFANNHFACSVGLATLRRLLAEDRALIEDVAQKGLYLRAGLERLVARYPQVYAAVSGQGLMQGLRLAPWSGENTYLMALAQSSGNAVPLVCGYLLNEHGILTAPVFNHSDVLRIEPPLIITTAQIDRLFVALEAAAKLLSRGDYARLFGHITAPTGPRGAPPEDQDFATPRYPIVPPSASERRLGKFVFFVHPTEFDDLVRSQPPAFDYFTPDQKEAWHAWLTSWCAKRYDPGVVYHMPALRSKQGGYAEGWLVSCALTPAQMMRLSPRERNELMGDYLAVARDLEPDIVGLGAFTSIITRCGQDIVDCGLNITTGNSLTAMASAESLKIAAALQGMDLTQVKTGVIGASGSVGRLACKKLISTCTDLTLFGNPTNPHALKNLEVLAGELYRDAISRWREAGPVGIGKTLAAGLPNAHWLPEELMGESAEARRNLYRAVSTYFADLGREAPIKITVDLKTKLPEIGAMISATSQGQAFIDPDYLAPNAIVCDSARPPDVRASVRETRPDVFVYEGGLVKLPQPVRFGVNNCISLPTGINLACLCETIALAMGGERRHYSLGTEVPLAEAEEVYALALAHGFEVSLLDSYGEILTGETGTLLEQQAQHRVRRS